MNHQVSVRDKYYCAGEKEQLNQEDLHKRGEAWDDLCRMGKIQV